VIATRWYWVGLIACGGLLAVAYFYFQQALGLAPCPLCMFQRGALVGVAFFCLLGIVFRPKKIGSKFLAFGVTLSCLAGLPVFDVIQKVLAGSGECAEVQWSLLGFSMPEWMVFVFVVMTLISLKFLFQKERNYFSGALGR